MIEHWVQVRIPASQRAVVVVDVSATSENLWPIFHSLLLGLAESFPADDQPDVVFLGDSARRPLSEFIAQAESLYPRNKSRGRVLAPLVETFSAGWPRRVVVLLGHPIHDLDDWTNTEQFSRVKLVSPTPGSWPPSHDAVHPLRDVQQVAELLRSLPPRVRIRSTNAIPFFWDQVGYSFQSGALTADFNSARDVRIGWLAQQEPKIEADLLHHDGSRDQLQILPCDPLEPAGWKHLTPAELTILDTWRSQRSIHCTHCHAEHAPGQMCRVSQLFPSWKDLPPGSFVVVRVQLFQASYQPWPCPAYKLPADHVLLRSPSQPEPREWQPSETGWQAAPTTWPLFFPLDREQYLLALPYAEGRHA